MRLPDDGIARLGALTLALALASCGGSAAHVSQVESTGKGTVTANGPSADYPVVLGEPFKIGGVEYVPADNWNYDEVGFVTFDNASGVTASHRTLPLPSYIEVTSLETGKTIWVRVERRGPMTGSRNRRPAGTAASSRRRHADPPAWLPHNPGKR